MMPILEGQNLVKDYPGTRALDGVDFQVLSGTVHALLGENGAGKSTLVNLMSGVIQPDGGRILLEGNAVILDSPRDAHSRGIAVVHQELSLLPSLTVAENLSIFDPPRARSGLLRIIRKLDRREMRRRARESLERLEIPVDADAMVSSLSAARRQLIEIARCVQQASKVVLLDEPTSSLSPIERDELFGLVRQLRADGVAIVFITHMLREALTLSDQITVLRDGRKAGSFAATDTTEDELIQSMTGRKIGTKFSQGEHSTLATAVRLKVTGVSSGELIHDVNLYVRSGEILGIAGVVGAGRTEILETIVGYRHRSAGEVVIDGQPASFRSPRAALSAGVALVPEDRQLDGIFHALSVGRNLTTAAINTVPPNAKRRREIASPALIRKMATLTMKQFQIKATGTNAPIESLSGGNQQKVVLARVLATDPAVILADEPTRGVSIDGKVEIYRLLRNAANRGAAVVVVSSDLDELAGLCDRVTIVQAGTTIADSTPPQTGDQLLAAVLAAAPKEQAS